MARLRPFARRVRRYAHSTESWTWWELPIERMTRYPLPPECRLVPVQSEHELQRFLALTPVWFDDRNADPRLRIAHGGTPWMVVDEQHTLLTFWQFEREAPLSWLDSGWLQMPEGTALLEDAIVQPELRGRGVAPGTATKLAEALQPRGVRTFIVRIADWNAPSIKMIQKAGYTQFAQARVDYAGPVTSVRAWTVDGGGASGDWFVDAIDGQRSLRWHGEPIELPHWVRLGR